MVDNAWEGLLTAVQAGLPLHVAACNKCKFPYVDHGRWAKFGHKKLHCHNCGNKSEEVKEPIVCNLLGAWHPEVVEGHLWFDKAAPKEFVGEVGEMVA